MLIYKCVIPINPATKKNSSRILFNRRKGVYFIAPSERYTNYQRDCGMLLRRIPQPINKPVNIKCLFYRDSERRCDLTNLLEAIDDILVNYAIIADDNFKIIVGHDGSRVFVDREHPRTEIYIEEVEDG